MRRTVTAIAIGLASAAAGFTHGAEPPEPIDSQETELALRGGTDGLVCLEQAVSRALRLNPALAASSFRLAAAEARITQAGLFPNPEIDIEAENFGGQGGLSGYSAAETTAIISQSIPLGRRLGRARRVAEADHLLTRRDLDASRLVVTASATTAFYRLVAAQEREELTRRMVELAERFEETVRARVEAGKVSPVEATRATIEVGRARSQAARAAFERQAVKNILAATWGSSTPDFDRVIGTLPEPDDPPGFEQIRASLNTTPDIARLDDEIERAQRAADLERSLRMPDLAVSVGPRRHEETGESAWVAGLSFSIPLFDRNQGSRKAAEFEAERAKRDAEAARVARESELAALLHLLRAGAEEISLMAKDVVPAANDALVATEIAYSAGKFGFLNVLDAQRALFDAQSLLLDRREEYALALIKLGLLTGDLPTGINPAEPSNTSGAEDGKR